MTALLDCTTSGRKRRHRSTFLAPTAGTRGIGKMGRTICGQDGAMDQECLDNPDWQWKTAAKPIALMPTCKSCAIAELKILRERQERAQARHALENMEPMTR